MQYNINVGTEAEAFVTAYSYIYDKNGNIAKIEESTGSSVSNRYSPTGNLLNSINYTDSDIISSLKLEYDSNDRLQFSTLILEGESQANYKRMIYMWQGYTYGSASQLKTVSTSYHGVPSPSSTIRKLTSDTAISYDPLGRTTQRSTTVSLEEVAKLTVNQTYTYLSRDRETSGIVAGMTTSVTAAGASTPLRSETFNYTYDGNGNITCIKNAGGSDLYRYYYDIHNQLIREDNIPLNKTYVYTYDNSGNILSKSTYALTSADSTPSSPTQSVSYTYSTANGRLTSFNGSNITYDEIGNPLNYRGGMTMTWERGRQLKSIGTGGGTYTYTYNSTGTRIGKSGSGLNVQYILNGTQIVRQLLNNDYVIDYVYHETGTPMAFVIYKPSNNTYTYYFYETNMFGDIVGVCDENGQRVIYFTYDAWGNFTTQWSYYPENSDIFYEAILYRYRGYIYDTETGFYYLQSRYYDPVTCRFINADGYISTGQGLLGYNMYAYCGNNPVNRVDVDGESWLAIALVVGIGLIAATLNSCGATKTKIQTNNDGEMISYSSYDDALNAGNRNILSKAQNGTPDNEDDDIEYMVNIYYNAHDQLFYISQPHTSNLENEVSYKPLIKSKQYTGMELVGYTHYHPYSRESSLLFSPADISLATDLQVAMHIVNSIGLTNSSYKYMSIEKRKIVLGG